MWLRTETQLIVMLLNLSFQLCTIYFYLCICFSITSISVFLLANEAE